MPITYPYTQYGGIWKLNAASAAQGAGTWPTPPAPHLLAWGSNTYGQLGLGNTTDYSSPKQVGNLTNWLAVGASRYSNYAIKTDGTLWAWGKNNYGQLGLGNTTNYSSPKQVGALTNWSSITQGLTNDVLALKTDGTLWGWGRNSNGELGLGNTTSYSSPKQIGSQTNWLKIVGKTQNIFALKTNGTLWAWGYNGFGGLGQNNINPYSSPVQVGTLTNWANVAAGNGSFIAVKTDGTLWTCGRNQFGELGNGNTTNYSSPIQVGALTNWQTPGSNVLDSFCVKTDGTLWAIGGWNLNGELGLGNTTSYSSPKQVGALTNWVSCDGTGLFSLSIKTDGTLWAWGGNNNGQLGLGNTTYYSSPKQVGNLTSWLAICGGNYYGAVAIAIT